MSFMIDQILASSSSTNNKCRSPLHSLTNTLVNISSTTSTRKERRMWQCEMCPKAFDRPSLLTRHVRTHTGKFFSLHSIVRFLLFATIIGEKPHECDVCSKAFSTSSSLNTHRRIHSGEKPHVCDICDKRFTASSNLYYHKLTHSKVRNLTSVFCFSLMSFSYDCRINLTNVVNVRRVLPLQVIFVVIHMFTMVHGHFDVQSVLVDFRSKPI